MIRTCPSAVALSYPYLQWQISKWIIGWLSLRVNKCNAILSDNDKPRPLMEPRGKIIPLLSSLCCHSSQNGRSEFYVHDNYLTWKKYPRRHCWEPLPWNETGTTRNVPSSCIKRMLVSGAGALPRMTWRRGRWWVVVTRYADDVAAGRVVGGRDALRRWRSGGGGGWWPWLVTPMTLRRGGRWVVVTTRAGRAQSTSDVAVGGETASLGAPGLEHNRTVHAQPLHTHTDSNYAPLRNDA